MPQSDKSRNIKGDQSVQRVRFMPNLKDNFFDKTFDGHKKTNLIQQKLSEN